MSETAVNGVEPIIFLDDVHVTFRTRTGSILHPNLVHAVQGVTIKLMPGQTIGIVGESGCGKSTTANVMCGLQAPTSGKVYFKGKDVTKRTAEDRRHMGRVISVVFQNPANEFVTQNVEDEVCVGLRLWEPGLSDEACRQRARGADPDQQPLRGDFRASFPAPHHPLERGHRFIAAPHHFRRQRDRFGRFPRADSFRQAPAQIGRG